MANPGKAVCAAICFFLTYFCSPALAQQRTGQLFMVCTHQSDPAAKLSFTIDYDNRTVLGTYPGSKLGEFGDRSISWYRRLGSTDQIFTFMRDTGVLNVYWERNDNYLCEPGKQRY